MTKDEKIPRPKEPAIGAVARQPLQLRRKCACGGPAGPEGVCTECQEEMLRRKADGPGVVTAVPPSVHKVLRSPGTPLDAVTRAAMEPHFRHDFGKVRVHADREAAESAREVRAAAYTVGRDVVFGEGQFAPESARGRQLIAHELTHVVQQSEAAPATMLNVGAADGPAEREADRAAATLSGGPRADVAGPRRNPSVQRAPDAEWNKIYGTHQSFLQKPYEEYKSGLGDIRATTEGGLSENKGRPIDVMAGDRTPAAKEITFPVLKEIFPLLKEDVEGGVVPEKQVKDYLASLNTAFKMMKIDTVEAQAYYLAHAYVESQQFRLLTEVGEKNPQHWATDAKTPDSPAARKYYKDTYGIGGDVNPGGRGEFIGRGPVQVTHKPEYVEAIALIEKAAADYEEKAKKGDKEAAKFADLAKRAARDIKKNPEQAANPEYTFLFSAAFLKGKGADVSAANKTPGQTKWTGADVVGGGHFKKGSAQDKALFKKAEAYTDIYCVLMREAKNAGVKQAEDKYQKGCKGHTPSAGKASSGGY